MKILTIVVICIVVSALMRFLFSKSQSPAINTGDSKSLKADKSFGYIGWIGLLLCLVFVVLFAFDVEVYTQGQNILLLLILVTFVFASCYLILFTKNSHVMFDEEKIVSTNFLRRSKTIYWKDIHAVGFLSIPKWVSLQGESKTIYIYALLRGFGQFKQQLATKIDKKKYQDSYLNAVSSL